MPRNRVLFEEIWARMSAAAERSDRARAREEAQAGFLLAALWDVEPARRLERVEADACFASLALADRLIAKGEEAPAGEARDLAELALAIVRRLAPGRYGASRLAAREAVAWCLLGDARRRQGEPGRARDAFRAAAARLRGEPFDLPERALYCRRLADLERVEGAVDEALALYARAARLHGARGERSAEAAALAELGRLYLDEGDPESALAPLQMAAACAAADGGGALRARLALALCYAELGMVCEARGELERAGELAGDAGPLERARLLWTTAQVADRSGAVGAAAARSEEAVRALLAAGDPLAAAAAALELAQLHWAGGRSDDLLELGRTLAPLLLPGALPRGPGAAFRFALHVALQSALQSAPHGAAGRDPVEVLAQAAEYLLRARENPALRFEPAGDPLAELPWDELAPERRRALCRAAGLDASWAELPAAAIDPEDRDVLALILGAHARLRIVFAPEPGTAFDEV